MQPLPLDEIRRELTDRSPSKVAQATGLHYQTIRRIRDNQDRNPTYATLLALSEYLHQQRQP